jgi:hypothetical protein
MAHYFLNCFDPETESRSLRKNYRPGFFRMVNEMKTALVFRPVLRE